VGAGDPENAYPGNPFGLGARAGSAGSAIYITDVDTQLRITTANSVAGVVIGITGLRTDEKGLPQPIDETHTPNTDRSSKTQDYRLGKGTLLRLTVFVTAGVPLSGQTYVLAQLIRGVTGPRKVISTILGGYVTAVQALGFPGSPIVSSTEGEPVVRSILGTTPGVGTNFVETVPTGARWELMSIYNEFTTSGVGGQRTCDLVIDDGTQFLGWYLSNAGVLAGQSWRITWAQNLPNIIYAGAQRVISAFGNRPIMRAGARFRSVTDNLDAADSYTRPQYVVREWLEVA